MRVTLGNNHAGFPLKPQARAVLDAAGVEVVDRGTDSLEPVDFPDVAGRVCADRSFLDATFSTDEAFRRRVANLHDLKMDAARELTEGAAGEAR